MCGVGGTPIDVAPPLTDGRYRLTREIGSGGMARVYEGYDTRLDVHRAIKILDPGMSLSTGIRKRFENEARTMARLQHRHIVGVLDVGVDGDRPYIVMELVEGGNLWDRVRRHGPLPPRLACEVLADVLAALDVAHQSGVVHRDVKPHNVLLDRDGTAKVTDFGIAHLSTPDSGVTRTGAVMGTLAYMAPEQRQDARSVGPAADVFSAGCTLYALVTGKDPFELWSQEVRAEALAQLPGPIVDVIERACRFKPEERYGSAAEMRGAVLAVASRLPLVPEDVAPLAAPRVPRGERPTAPTHAPDSATFSATSLESDVDRTASETTAATPRSRGRMLVAGVAVVALLGVAGAWAMGVVPGTGDAPTGAPSPSADATVVAAAEPPAAAVAEEPPPPVVAPPVVSPSPTEPRTTRTGRAKPAPPPEAIPPKQPDPVPVTSTATTAGSETPPVPPPVPVEPTAPAGPTARVFLNTRPASLVFVDGVDMGRTPFDRKLPHGAHTVKLQRIDADGTLARDVALGETGFTLCWDWAANAPCAR